jgi:hypothetical protein
MLGEFENRLCLTCAALSMRGCTKADSYQSTHEEGAQLERQALPAVRGASLTMLSKRLQDCSHSAAWTTRGASVSQRAMILVLIIALAYPLTAASQSPPSQAPQEQGNGVAKPPSYVLWHIDKRRDLFYAEGESATADAVVRAAAALGIRVGFGENIEFEPNVKYAYDPVNNVIWISEKEELERNTHSQDAKTSIIHELMHGLQNQAVLNSAKNPRERLNSLQENASKMTEQQYADAKWAKDLEAEKMAIRVEIEAMDHYERSRGLSGFSEDDKSVLFKQEVDAYTSLTKDDGTIAHFKDGYHKLTGDYGTKEPGRQAPSDLQKQLDSGARPPAFDHWTAKQGLDAASGLQKQLDSGARQR